MKALSDGRYHCSKCGRYLPPSTHVYFIDKDIKNAFSVPLDREKMDVYCTKCYVEGVINAKEQK